MKADLLQLEDVLVEEVLDALVGKVDAELLEAVLHEVLEAEQVEDGDDVLVLLLLGLLAVTCKLIFKLHRFLKINLFILFDPVA